MNIENVGKDGLSEEKLPEIVNRIFAICKEDPNFPLKDKVEQIEFTIDSLKKKIKRQDHLMNQAKQIEEDFSKRINMLDGKNYSQRETILESLGSEI